MKKAENIIEKCSSELVFTTSRSGGSGGQHVNKVETKVTLRWNIANSQMLEDQEKVRLSEKLSRHINQDGELVIYHQTERSQKMNKERVIKKWKKLVVSAFHEPKKRKPTKPSAESKRKRLQGKARRSEIKSTRKKPDINRGDFN